MSSVGCSLRVMLAAFTAAGFRADDIVEPDPQPFLFVSLTARRVTAAPDEIA